MTIHSNYAIEGMYLQDFKQTVRAEMDKIKRSNAAAASDPMISSPNIKGREDIRIRFMAAVLRYISLSGEQKYWDRFTVVDLRHDIFPAIEANLDPPAQAFEVVALRRSQDQVVEIARKIALDIMTDYSPEGGRG